MSGGIDDNQKVSLILKNPSLVDFEFTGMLQPLSQDKGVVFPYTPTIGFGHAANYGDYTAPHSLYQPQFYANTVNPTIGITATFTANNFEEAKHTAACLHFFKSLTKADFGVASGQRAGTPPPVCRFSAYGVLHAQNVPVVVASVNYNLTEDVDYVQVNDFSVPASLLVTLDLRVQQSPIKVRDNFNVKSYRSGALLRGGKGFI